MAKGNIPAAFMKKAANSLPNKAASVKSAGGKFHGAKALGKARKMGKGN